ncbi:MAG: DUF4240 domain-containing protein [Planctomycetes bacterium]|nr:DUF4240 domain-containing protein [Planctomycetota bacterium]
MDPITFWQIVAAARRADPLAHADALVEGLRELPWPEIVAFQVRFDELVSAANVGDLRAAAHLINGSADAGAFRDFRVWLVARGRDTYERARRDPDSLADELTGDPVDGFGLDTAALRAYESRTGGSDFYARLDRPLTAALLATPDWDHEDRAELARRFPRLSALYPEPADAGE